MASLRCVIKKRKIRVRKIRTRGHVCESVERQCGAHDVLAREGNKGRGDKSPDASVSGYAAYTRVV